MSTPFNAGQGLIIVTARIWGPTADTHVQLALDTGATSTVINLARLVSVGYDPAAASDRVRMTTGSGVEFVPRLALDRIEALGQQQMQFVVICHTLPASAPIDGLLGLDFLRNQQLTIDFRAGQISLT